MDFKKRFDGKTSKINKDGHVGVVATSHQPIEKFNNRFSTNPHPGNQKHLENISKLTKDHIQYQNVPKKQAQSTTQVVGKKGGSGSGTNTMVHQINPSNNQYAELIQPKFTVKDSSSVYSYSHQNSPKSKQDHNYSQNMVNPNYTPHSYSEKKYNANPSHQAPQVHQVHQAHPAHPHVQAQMKAQHAQVKQMQHGLPGGQHAHGQAVRQTKSIPYQLPSPAQIINSNPYEANPYPNLDTITDPQYISSHSPKQPSHQIKIHSKKPPQPKNPKIPINSNPTQNSSGGQNYPTNFALVSGQILQNQQNVNYNLSPGKKSSLEIFKSKRGSDNDTGQMPGDKHVQNGAAYYPVARGEEERKKHFRDIAYREMNMGFYNLNVDTMSDAPNSHEFRKQNQMSHSQDHHQNGIPFTNQNPQSFMPGFSSNFPQMTPLNSNQINQINQINQFHPHPGSYDHSETFSEHIPPFSNQSNRIGPRSTSHSAGPRGGNFKPYTLREYQHLKSDKYFHLGGLGPNMDADWNQRRKKASLMTNFSEKVRMLHKENRTSQPLPPHTRNTIPSPNPALNAVGGDGSRKTPNAAASVNNLNKVSNRQKALEFAKNISKPKVRLSDKYLSNKYVESPQELQMNELERLEMQHNQYLQRVQKMKQQQNQ